MNKTLEIIGIALFLIFILYLYYSAIRGIIKKKFSTIALLLITGSLARGASGGSYKYNLGNSRGPNNMLRTLENEEAINAAIAQLFFAVLFTIVIGFAFFAEKFPASSDNLTTIVPIAVILAVIVAVVFIVRIANKYKRLKKQ